MRSRAAAASPACAIPTACCSTRKRLRRYAATPFVNQVFGCRSCLAVQAEQELEALSSTLDEQLELEPSPSVPPQPSSPPKRVSFAFPTLDPAPSPPKPRVLLSDQPKPAPAPPRSQQPKPKNKPIPEPVPEPDHPHASAALLAKVSSHACKQRQARS